MEGGVLDGVHGKKHYAHGLPQLRISQRLPCSGIFRGLVGRG